MMQVKVEIGAMASGHTVYIGMEHVFMSLIFNDIQHLSTSSSTAPSTQ
jgi:hypothetical protein